MNDDDLTGCKIYEGELKEHELNVLKVLVDEGIDDDTDARFLFLSLRRSLSNFSPRLG